MDEIKQLVSEMKFNVLDMTEFGKGVLYIDYDENTNELFAGDCTNYGIRKEYSVTYNKDMSLDYNLQGLFDEIINS